MSSQTASVPDCCESVVQEPDGAITAVYKPVVLYDHRQTAFPMGPFTVRIEPPANAWSNPRIDVMQPPDQVSHPHLSHTDLCMGNFRGAVITAIQDGLYLPALVMIGEILDSYNPKDSYTKLENVERCRRCHAPRQYAQLQQCWSCYRRYCTGCLHPHFHTCPDCTQHCPCCGTAQRSNRLCDTCEHWLVDDALPRAAEERFRALLQGLFPLPPMRHWGLCPSMTRSRIAWKKHARRYFGAEPNEALTEVVRWLPGGAILKDAEPPTAILEQDLLAAEEALLFDDWAAPMLPDNATELIAKLQLPIGLEALLPELTPQMPSEEAHPLLRDRLSLALLYHWKTLL